MGSGAVGAAPQGGTVTTIAAANPPGADVPARPAIQRGYGIYSAEQYLDLDFEAVEPLVGDGHGGIILDRDGKMIIAGPPGVGKSNLGLDLTRALVSGKRWLGRFPIPKQGCRVLYVDLEMGGRSLQRRLKKLQIQGAALSSLHIFRFPYLRMETNAGYNGLRDVLARCKPDVVIIDPFRGVHGLDENNSNEMAAILSQFNQLMADFGCAFVLVHHSRKGEKGRAEHSQDALRGSTALAAWASSILVLSPSTPPGRIQADMAKARDAEEYIAPLCLDFDRPTFTFEPTERPEHGQKLTRGQVVAMVREMGMGKHVLRQPLVAALKERHVVSERTAGDRIRECASSGELVESDVPGSHGTKVYSLPGGQECSVDLSALLG